MHDYKLPSTHKIRLAEPGELINRAQHKCTAGERDGKMNELLGKPEFLSSLVQCHACSGKKHSAEAKNKKKKRVTAAGQPSVALAASGVSFWAQEPGRQTQRTGNLYIYSYGS